MSVLFCLMLDLFLAKICFSTEEESTFSNFTSPPVEAENMVSVAAEQVEATLQKAAYIMRLKDERFTLWRRIALVESTYGEDDDVIKANPLGGVWQVHPGLHEVMEDYYHNNSMGNDDVNYMTAMDKKTNVNDTDDRFLRFLDVIEDVLNESCFFCQYDYSDPLRSAIGARLYMELMKAPIDSSYVNEHADWWVAHYHPGGNATYFIEKSLNFDIESGFFRDLKADIWFNLDGSWFVFDDEFEIVTKFVSAIACEFKVSRDDVRLAFSTYVLEHEVHVWFQNSTNIQVFNSMLSEVDNPANTKTGLILERLIRTGYKNDSELYVYPYRQRVLFIIANGNNTDNSTNAVAQARKADIVTLIAGYGSSQKFEQRINDLKTDNEGLTALAHSNFDTLTRQALVGLRFDLCLILMAKKITMFLEHELESTFTHSMFRDIEKVVVNRFNDIPITCLDCGDRLSIHLKSLIEQVLQGRYSFEGIRTELISVLQQWVRENLYLTTLDPCRTWPIDWWLLIEGAMTYSKQDFEKALKLIGLMSSNFAISSKESKLGLVMAYDNVSVTTVDIAETINDTHWKNRLSEASQPIIPVNSGAVLKEILEIGFGSQSDSRFNEEHVAKIIVVITDRNGEDNLLEAYTKAEIQNITIILLVIGDDTKVMEFKKFEWKMKRNHYALHLISFNELPLVKKYILAWLYEEVDRRIKNLLPRLSENVQITLSVREGESLHLVAHVRTDKYLYLKFYTSEDATGKAYTSVLTRKPSAGFHDAAYTFQNRKVNIFLDPRRILHEHPYLIAEETEEADSTFPVFITIVNTGNTDFRLSINTSSELVRVKTTTPQTVTNASVEIEAITKPTANASSIVWVASSGAAALLITTGVFVVLCIKQKKRKKKLKIAPESLPMPANYVTVKSAFSTSDTTTSSSAEMHSRSTLMKSSGETSFQGSLRSMPSCNSTTLSTTSSKNTFASISGAPAVIAQNADTKTNSAESEATPWTVSILSTLSEIDDIEDSLPTWSSTDKEDDKEKQNNKQSREENETKVKKRTSSGEESERVEDLKKRLAFLIENRSKMHEVFKVTLELQNSTKFHSDSETKMLLSKAKNTIIHKTLQYLSSLVSHAIETRSVDDIKIALDEVAEATHARLTHAQVSQDIELNINVQKALGILAHLQLLQELKQSSLRILNTSISEKVTYLSLPKPTKLVLEAVYAMVSTQAEKAYGTAWPSSVLEENGKNSFMVPISQLKVHNVTPDQAKMAKALLNDPMFSRDGEAIEDTWGTVRKWLMMVVSEVEKRDGKSGTVTNESL